MNNVNIDTIRVGTAPLGVGDETAVQQQMPAEKKILSGPAVTVNSSFDSLVDWLARDIEKSFDSQAHTRLTQSVSTITARAGNIKESQKKVLDECGTLTDQIAADKKKLESEQAERTRLEEEIAKAKERESAPPPASTEGTESAENTESAERPASVEANGPSVKELEEQLAACNERIGALEKSIARNSEKLNAELAKLDDKSLRVFAAAVRVSSSEATSYLEILRSLGEDEGEHGELPAIDAFNRLLAGEDIEKVLMEELGIRG